MQTRDNNNTADQSQQFDEDTISATAGWRHDQRNRRMALLLLLLLWFVAAVPSVSVSYQTQRGSSTMRAKQ
jgi:hypothetical protein